MGQPLGAIKTWIRGALGVVDESEQPEIAAHLVRERPVCTAGIRGAMTTTATMSGAVAESNPPHADESSSAPAAAC